MKAQSLTLCIVAGAEPWAPRAEQLAPLVELLNEPSTVVLWPRRLGLEERRRIDPNGPAPGFYAFRGWCPTGSTTAHLLVDETETRASIVWAILHELTHVVLPNVPLLTAAFRNIPKPADYHTSDKAHEDRAEERLANFIADCLAPKLGSGTGYDRAWWRARVRRVQAQAAASRRAAA